MTGYLNTRHAESLAEFGQPVFLPGAQGWLLERAISGVPHRDAMETYPLLCCAGWGKKK